MADKSRPKSLSGPTGLANGAVSQLRQEYQTYQELMQAQPPLVQRFLETQAVALADAIMQGLPQVRFTLPDRVVVSEKEPDAKPVVVPKESREQMAGGLMDRLTRTDLRTALRLRLGELEQSTIHSVAMSACLLRHSIARHMVHVMLPSGRTVQYVVAEGDEIPTIPVKRAHEPKSALMAPSDAIGIGEEEDEAGRGPLCGSCTEVFFTSVGGIR
jgi:hypothetical protein